MSTQGKPEVITARAHNIYIGSYWEPICNQRLSQFVVIRAHNIYKADSSLLISICWSDLPFLCLLHSKAQQQQHGGPRGLLLTTYWYDHCGQHETEQFNWRRPYGGPDLKCIINVCSLWPPSAVSYCPETSLTPGPGPGRSDTWITSPRSCTASYLFPIFCTGYEPGEVTIGNVNSRCKRQVCHSITISLWECAGDRWSGMRVEPNENRWE